MAAELTGMASALMLAGQLTMPKVWEGLHARMTKEVPEGYEAITAYEAWKGLLERAQADGGDVSILGEYVSVAATLIDLMDNPPAPDESPLLRRA